MPDTTPPSAPQQNPVPGLPPIDPKALVATALAVLRTPADFFKSIKDEKGYQKPLTFSVAACLVYAVLAALGTLFHGAVVQAIVQVVLGTLIGGLAGPFIGAIAIWAICTAFGSKATWEHAVPIAAYSSVFVVGVGIAALASFLSGALATLVALVSWLYGLYLAYVGAKTLMFDAAPDARPAS